MRREYRAIGVGWMQCPLTCLPKYQKEVLDMSETGRGGRGDCQPGSFCNVSFLPRPWDGQGDIPVMETSCSFYPGGGSWRP